MQYLLNLLVQCVLKKMLAKGLKKEKLNVQNARIEKVQAKSTESRNV